MTPRDSIIVNFDSLDAKRQLLARIGGLKGVWRIELAPYRPKRSNEANRYYWGVVVDALFQYLSAQDFEITHREQAHELLKQRFLVADVVNKETSEVIGKRTRSTTELTTAEFSHYCDACRQWLLDFFGIAVIEPEPDHNVTDTGVE